MTQRAKDRFALATLFVVYTILATGIYLFFTTIGRAQSPRPQDLQQVQDLQVLSPSPQNPHPSYMQPPWMSDPIHTHEGLSPEVDKYYTEWRKPDNRNSGCCNKVDCYPTIMKQTESGLWMALRREDKKWLRVPAHKIEHDKPTPDGRSHICAAKPGSELPYPPDGVICAVIGTMG